MEIFRHILDIINYIFMAILGLGFLPQIIYVLLFFLKPKRYPKAKEFHKVAIFIPARNESATISNTVKSMFMQNYPSDKFAVYVVADNCSDNTAELAREAGARVFERFDNERRSRGWALDYGTKLALEEDPDIEFFVMFDADNVAHCDYLSKMNDAFESGVEFARGYSNSKNIDYNTASAISGIYYLRDSRLCCQSRSALGLDQQLMGPGMMVTAEFIKEKGFDAHSISEDAEFTYNRMLEGKRTKYVDEAMYYEEQPTNMKDVFNRNIRFGYGLNKLFYNHGFRMLGKFFTTGRLSFIDMFLQLMFIPIAMICCIWIPLYYGYTFIEAIVMSDTSALHTWLSVAGIAISCIFYIPFVLQALFVVLLERKKLKCKPSKLIFACLVFPLYMIVYMLSIAIGTFSRKPKWKQINHHVNVDLDSFLGKDAGVSSEMQVASDLVSSDDENQTLSDELKDSALDLTQNIDDEMPSNTDEMELPDDNAEQVDEKEILQKQEMKVK